MDLQLLIPLRLMQGLGERREEGRRDDRGQRDGCDEDSDLSKGDRALHQHKNQIKPDQKKDVRDSLWMSAEQHHRPYSDRCDKTRPGHALDEQVERQKCRW